MLIKIKHLAHKFLKKCRGTSIKKSTLGRDSKIESGTVFYNSTMGRHSFCGYDCTLLNVDVGSFCSIGALVRIGGVAHPVDFVSTSPVFLSHKDSVRVKYSFHKYLPEIRTTVGHDVWIGDGVFIKAGITIGDGSVVGMGAVVTKNVAPYSIVAGNPARLIRMRFDPAIVKALLKMKWWDLPDSELSRLGKDFNDPRALLRSEGFL